MPVARIGIIGGGQLGRMMVKAARRLGCNCVVLDPAPGSPAGQVAGHQIVGDYHDPARLRELVESTDVTTFDIEDIDTVTLIELEREGRCIHPSLAILSVIQDKFRQKQLLREALAELRLPVAETAIRRRVACRSGVLDGRTVMDAGTCGRAAADDIRQLIDEVPGA